ncbi:DUF397 domain-containing protein [Streptomyces sp. RPA4-2]|uniref:DUF397 domain-containing protein n=1 Tax=unclassified Streptomyces TaxID=2593676 RepID=UPI00143E8E6F|nr:DUF397 domain-containing protein [Streptomyces sp. RPA4-2]QIY62860.1 DUF397 domain-containing protein [Streptomyces sp. RPA4-2]
MPVSSSSGPDLAWFKSSYSGGNTTECVEAAFVPSGVCIRDSKHPEGPQLPVAAEAWATFIAAAALRDGIWQRSPSHSLWNGTPGMGLL